ncbi:hypothetical protein MUK42_36922 [Musa troglodytarum]|uniref:Ribosomal protein L9 domain-containing protein n=1 Tax=Musa troglodytarum TaxID=320322 RepID=A0A9E7ECP8_9LILI|nr:hypothetical protein MUK42_36922 [Musa troglodytarum]
MPTASTVAWSSSSCPLPHRVGGGVGNEGSSSYSWFWLIHFFRRSCVLREGVAELEKKGELRDVRAGLYRNFLLPTSKAQLVTPLLLKSGNGEIQRLGYAISFLLRFLLENETAECRDRLPLVWIDEH